MIEQLLTVSTSEKVSEVKFLDEVPTANFINGLELASAIGLNAGTAQHSTEPWLHFALDGKTLYVAKKPYRSHVSWEQINTVGAAFGSKTVVINELEYKVRLLKSATGDTYIGPNGSRDTVGTWGSEWNRLMYPIHSGEPTDGLSGEGIRFGTLARYTDTDLVISTGNGRWSWCQENSSSNAAQRVFRGNTSITTVNLGATSDRRAGHGWRPVLELVE